MALRLNLVLQGGGVRGIAYVGALESLPPDISLHTVAGTSAGSIVAALLALGRRHSEIETLMTELDFAKLLNAAEQARMTRLARVFANMDKPVGGVRQAVTLFGRTAKSLFRPIADVGYLIKNRGMHSNARLKDWLDTTFGDATFDDIKTAELYVIASDVSSRDFVVYSKAEYPAKRLSEAVLASASIPLFFRPVIETDRVLVDGGMLSNFPSHLFEHAEYPTIGLRLEGTKEKHRVDTFARYLGGMLNTMLEAHDKERTPQAHFTQFTIDTKDVSTFDFALTAAKKAFLIESGRKTGNRIPWRSIARDRPVLKFTDRHPDEILSWSLEQAGAAAVQAERESGWCHELSERLFLDYFFEDDWGSRHILKFDYQVRGPMPFFIRQFDLTTPPAGQGMMECLPSFDCTPAPPDFSVHLIPWAADANRKGFVILMVPPITETSGRRGFTIRYSIKDDHRDKLCELGSDTFPLPARRRARHHSYLAVARFWVAKSLSAPVEVGCPNGWNSARSPTSLYEEAYTLAGAFDVNLALNADVTFQFVFKRVAPTISAGP